MTDRVTETPDGLAPVTVPASKRMRSDARLNQDRVLDAAAALLARSDTDATMKAIAGEAGVGIATLYRRFPTRDNLIEAVYRNETTNLAESASGLLRDSPPPAALRSWFLAFLDYMAAKAGMAEALPAILAGQEGLRTHSRDVLRMAVEQILTAGGADGSLRTGLDPDDVMMAIGGIALVTAHEHNRDLGTRLTDLLLHGLVAH